MNYSPGLKLLNYSPPCLVAPSQAWCVLGNLSSLQREHAAAISLFQRATQLDASCAYAFTLLGHEHLAVEDLDRALACYRCAQRLDSRHYNAMWVDACTAT